MKRPATSVAVADASLNNPHCQLRRRRSFSAATATGLAFIQHEILKNCLLKSLSKTSL
jgi:hypothetical protein